MNYWLLLYGKSRFSKTSFNEVVKISRVIFFEETNSFFRF